MVINIESKIKQLQLYPNPEKSLSLYVKAITHCNLELLEKLLDAKIPFSDYWDKLKQHKNPYALENSNINLSYYKNNTPSLLNLICFFRNKSKNLAGVLEFVQNKYPEIIFNQTPSIFKYNNLDLINNFKCEDRFLLLNALCNQKFDNKEKALEIIKHYIEKQFLFDKQKCLDNLLLEYLSYKEVNKVSLIFDLFKNYKNDTFIFNEGLNSYNRATKLFTHRNNLVGEDTKFPLFFYALSYASLPNYNFFKEQPDVYKEGINWLKKNPAYILNIASFSKVQDMTAALGIDLSSLRDKNNNNYMHYYLKYFMYEKPSVKIIKQMIKYNKNLLEEKNLDGQGFAEILEKKYHAVNKDKKDISFAIIEKMALKGHQENTMPIHEKMLKQKRFLGKNKIL